MSYTAILITAILVSIDALFIGMFFGTQKNFKFKHLLITVAIISVICLLAHLAACIINNYITLDISIISGTLFLLLGLKNIFSKNGGEKNLTLTLKKNIFFASVVAIDGAMATFTVAFFKETILTPVIVSFIHFAFAFIGSALTSKIKFTPRLQNIVSGTCLIMLGVLKISGIL